MAKEKAAKPKKQIEERRQCTVYLPVDLMKQAKIYGIRNDIEFSQVVTDALGEYLKRVDK